jgi:hypothetical protein
MSGDLLRVLERSAVLHIGRDARCTKCVAAGGIGQGGGLCSPLDHGQNVLPCHRILGKLVSLPDRPEERSFLFGGNACRIDPGVQVGRKIMMARHFVTLAAFLMQPQPRALAVLEVVLDPQYRRGAHAGEAVNHDTYEGAIAESAEFGHVDGVQQLPGLVG